MARVVLIEARPFDAVTGGEQPVRMAGGGSRPYSGYRGVGDWMAGIVAPPIFTTTIDFDETGPTRGAVPATSALDFAPSSAGRLSALAALCWPAAAVTMWEGDDRAGEPAWGTPALVGTVAGATVKAGVLGLTIADLGATLNVPILTARFAGTGGVEGVAVAAGRIKRRSWGRVAVVEARLLDPATNLYEVGDPANPLLAIDAVQDRGRGDDVVVVAWAGSIAATLAALLAAAVPRGGAAVAPSIACLRWWTTPSGPLTVVLRGEIGAGYVESAAGIAARLLAAVAGPGIVDLDAAIALRPAPAGLHVDTEGEMASQALGRLLFGVSLIWIMRAGGGVELRPFTFDDPVETVRSIDVIERQATYRPLRLRRVGYARNHRLHTEAEIAAPLAASDVVYDSGVAVSAKEPATAGADRTADTPTGTAVGAGLNADGTVKDGKVATSAITSGSVTGAGSTAFPAVMIPANEVTLAEITALPIGDGVDGRAQVTVSLTHDGTSTPDTSARFRLYVDSGSGWMLMRDKLSGIRTSGADTKWSVQVCFPVTVLATGNVSLKLTAQGQNLGGGGNSSGSWARDIQLDIFTGLR